MKDSFSFTSAAIITYLSASLTTLDFAWFMNADFRIQIAVIPLYILLSFILFLVFGVKKTDDDRTRIRQSLWMSQICKSNPFVIRQIRLRKQKGLSCVPSKPYLAFNQALSGFQSDPYLECGYKTADCFLQSAPVGTVVSRFGAWPSVDGKGLESLPEGSGSRPFSLV